MRRGLPGMLETIGCWKEGDNFLQVTRESNVPFLLKTSG